MNLKAKIFFSPFGYVIHIGLVLLSKMGKRCLIYGYRNSQGKYLQRCRIASTAFISDKNKLIIEDNVWVNHYVRIDTTGGVEIGEGCQIGYGSCILSHSSHISIRLMGYNYMEENPEERVGYILAPVKIGKYTFIGGGSYIMPGVTIGKGCVIGVNSVVNKDVPDYAIVVGSPAKVIGDTREIDRKYLSDDKIKRTYYDQNFVKSV